MPEQASVAGGQEGCLVCDIKYGRNNYGLGENPSNISAAYLVDVPGQRDLACTPASLPHRGRWVLDLELDFKHVPSCNIVGSFRIDASEITGQFTQYKTQ